MGVLIPGPTLAALVVPGGGGVTLTDSYDAGRHLTWGTIFGNTFDATSNELEIGAGHGGTGQSAEMAQSALNTDQHEASEDFAVANDNSTNSAAFVIVRKDPTLATETYYRGGVAHLDGGQFAIDKVVAGVPTNLTTFSGSPWVLDVFHTLKLRVTGAGTTTLQLWFDGGSLGTITDSSSPITGNKYTGHEVTGVAPSYLRCDNFLAADF